MSLFEYDKELHEKTIKEVAHEEGFNEGMEVGITQGKEIGIQQGREVGITQGKELGIMYGTIVTYYRCGKSIEEIAELTRQSPEYVKEILETRL